MYAILLTGGKQYKVQPGDVIRIEKLEKALGAEFDLTDVLMLGGDTPVFGAPMIKNAKVTVVITQQGKDRKVIIFKKKRRQGYRRFKTHRQPFTEIFVKSITGPDGKVTKSATDANVKDAVKRRAEKLSAKIEAQDADRAEAKATGVKPVKKVAVKKKTVKKVAKKTAAKKPAAKKTKKA